MFLEPDSEQRERLDQNEVKTLWMLLISSTTVVIKSQGEVYAGKVEWFDRESIALREDITEYTRDMRAHSKIVVTVIPRRLIDRWRYEPAT